MLLRRITKHVTEQNWFAVILDLLIVVFGVFIGMQVTNWNADNAGEKQATILLNRIYNDLQNDILSINAELEYQAVVRNYAVTAVKALNNKDAVSFEQFVIGAYQASQINPAWSYRATYNEMLSTGQINLIENETLKALIFGYFSSDFATTQYLLKIAPYREYIRGKMPMYLQDEIKDQCNDITIKVANTFGAKLPSTCSLDISEEALNQAAEFLHSQPDMLFHLQFQIAVNDTKVSNLQNYAAESKSLMKAIKAYQE